MRMDEGDTNRRVRPGHGVFVVEGYNIIETISKK
jgi:hypothetical protein